jgi:hypothetical protein
MPEAPRSKSFEDYYKNNKGIFYKTFEITINNISTVFDAYWGNPNIIFDNRLLQYHPLATKIFPKWQTDPEIRIYIHEGVEKNYTNAFEFILAHEIGHIWQYSILGINNPRGHVYLRDQERETWADYFAYKYFVKYRNINTFEQFISVLNDCDTLLKIIYNITPDISSNNSFVYRLQFLETLDKKFQIGYSKEDNDIVKVFYSLELMLSLLKELI